MQYEVVRWVVVGREVRLERERGALRNAFDGEHLTAGHSADLLHKVEVCARTLGHVSRCKCYSQD